MEIAPVEICRHDDIEFNEATEKAHCVQCGQELGLAEVVSLLMNGDAQAHRGQCPCPAMLAMIKVVNGEK